MNKRYIRLGLVVGVTGLVMVLVLGLMPALAAPAAPAAESAGPPHFEVVAGGLANPRGIAFGADGSMYIAEAGSGGAGPCVIGGAGSEECFGETGAVSRVMFDGAGMPISQTQVYTGFPSLAAKDTGEEGTGPNDVAVSADGSTLYILTGLGGDPAWRETGGPFEGVGDNFAQILTASLASDTWAPWVDIGDFEAANNPDGDEPNTNPFALTLYGDMYLVADAGANALLTVDMSGTVTTTAVFTDTLVEFPPGSGSMMPMDAVPTAVEVGPDMAYYVSQLTGFPFPPGGASIFRVEPGSDPEVYVTGFSSILDLAFDGDGNLYVLEMFANGMLSGNPASRITRVNSDMSRDIILNDETILSTDMEFGPDGMLYVVNIGLSPVAGQVVRVDPDPTFTRTVMLYPSKDNTLYESEAGTISNGAGEYMFAGMTGDGLARRAVVAFDAAFAIPQNATVLTAELSLEMSRALPGTSEVALHALEMDWGEGTSDAEMEEGAGALATTGDATWLHTFFDTETWTTPGGDFAATPSAATIVGGAGSYSWASAGTTADVQSWLTDPGGNYGWLLHGNEEASSTAKRFNTREHADPATHPVLTVTYEVKGFESRVYLPLILK